MSTNCKYCSEPEDKQLRPGLICENCICFVHLSCLQRSGTPGDLACDVFFDFICEDCSETKMEVFERNKFPWVNVILLALHHLSTQSYGISNRGYFHYKTHICSFIDKSWTLLFGQKTKQKKNWVGTIAGVLSVYNNLVFRSGSLELGETGWWKLMHGFSPCVAAHIIQELARDKPKGRPRNQMSLDYQLFIEKVTEMGYLNLIHNEEETDEVEGPPPAKKKRHYDPNSKLSAYDHYESDGRPDMLDYSYELTETPSEADSTYKFEFPASTQIPPYHSDSSSIHSLQQAVYDSDTQSAESNNTERPEQPEKEIEKRKKSVEEKPYDKRESLFSTELNSVDMPWKEKLPERRRDLVEMTHYEEIHLLKKIEGMIPRVRDPNKKADLCRIRANLALRRLKRHKHLPIFDLDKTVKLLGGYTTEDARETVNVDRVLDRFQRTYLIDSLCGTIASARHGAAVLPRIEPAPLRSAYSGALLKPFIRRDADTTPLWLAVQDELLRRTHRHIPGYSPPARGTIDYSYVQPQHMAAVNALCAHYFWPGIDLTEALQYPEFSCVVTYRRLVVGCAFLVPDARPGEAYISFVLTRPEWRRAGIASFMLYHLLQTCSGKDVTLHVSPTNPAIFLYQKFGFKVEELVQDFYEKYYDIDYKGCRHALFLRLIR